MKSPYDIIKKPVLTEKSYDQFSDRTYTFEVDKTANKIEIKKAIEEIFDVEVASVHTINSDGSGLTNLTNTTAEEWAPAWSPDGSQIAFQTDRDGNWEIYMMNADGSGQVNLTNNAADDQYPYLQPATGGMVPPPAARSD